jgi:hypothetical protein
LTFRVESADRQPVGIVADLLTDADGRTVRYVVVDVGDRLRSRLALLPVGAVEAVDWTDGRLFVALDGARLTQSPEYDPARPLDPALEAAVADYYAGAVA